MMSALCTGLYGTVPVFLLRSSSIAAAIVQGLFRRSQTARYYLVALRMYGTVRARMRQAISDRSDRAPESDKNIPLQPYGTYEYNSSVGPASESHHPN